MKDFFTFENFPLTFVWGLIFFSWFQLISVVLAAKVLGEAEIVDKGYKFIAHFEKVTGDTGSGDAEKLMKKVKRKNA